MSKETILCKCMICLKENENGLLVSKRKFNRHRKIQQEYLDDDDVEETSICYQEQNLEDIQQENVYQIEDVYQQEDVHQQEDVYQQEVMHQQEEDKNSDTESFDLDNEYYSDFDDDTDDDTDDDDDFDDSMDDDDDDDMNNDNAMQIDNESNMPNKEIIEGLKL